MGIHFDHTIHKQEYQRAWLFYATAGFITISFNTIWYYVNENYSETILNILDTLIFVQTIAFDMLQMGTSIIISTSFTVLLCHIHRRYALLNTFLRFLCLRTIYDYDIHSLNFLYLHFGIGIIFSEGIN